MKKLRDDFVDAYFRSDLRMARIAVALGSLTWASILLLGGYQFDRPSYVHLSKIAPQWVFGAAFGACGVLQLVRASRDVPITSGPIACVAATVIAALWLMVTLSLGFGLRPPPGMLAGNVAVCFLSLLVFFRTLARRG